MPCHLYQATRREDSSTLAVPSATCHVVSSRKPKSTLPPIYSPRPCEGLSVLASSLRKLLFACYIHLGFCRLSLVRVRLYSGGWFLSPVKVGLYFFPPNSKIHVSTTLMTPTSPGNAYRTNKTISFRKKVGICTGFSKCGGKYICGGAARPWTFGVVTSSIQIPVGCATTRLAHCRPMSMHPATLAQTKGRHLI